MTCMRFACQSAVGSKVNALWVRYSSQMVCGLAWSGPAKYVPVLLTKRVLPTIIWVPASTTLSSTRRVTNPPFIGMAKFQVISAEPAFAMVNWIVENGTWCHWSSLMLLQAVVVLARVKTVGCKAGPCGPIGPVAPVAPVAPVGPVGPGSPWGPAGPVAPAGPTGP